MQNKTHLLLNVHLDLREGAVTGMLAGMNMSKPGMNLSRPGNKHNNNVIIFGRSSDPYIYINIYIYVYMLSFKDRWLLSNDINETAQLITQRTACHSN